MSEPEPTQEQFEEADRWVATDPAAETLTEEEKRIASIAHAYGLAKQSEEIEKLKSRLFSEVMAMSAQTDQFDRLCCAAVKLLNYIRGNNSFYSKEQPGWFCDLYRKTDSVAQVLGEDFIKEWNQHDA